MAYEDTSGLASAYDRAPARPRTSRVVFREGQAFFAQGAELNEVQSIVARRGERVGNLTAHDGDRVSGAEALVDTGAGTVQCLAGTIYVRGDVHPVDASTLENVPMAGDVSIGVRLSTATVTEVEDPSLLGLEPGTAGEGEPGAARQDLTLAWGFSGDGGTGDLYQVYLLRDGVILDQTDPPLLSGIMQQIATYDRDANGSYIVTGHKVTALGKVNGDQMFSISEGVANIDGFKRTRDAALRYGEPEAWDSAVVVDEPHTFADGGSGTAVIALNHGPIDLITSVIVTKEVTETLVRGGTPDTMDPLTQSSVVSIESVTQGGTTYVAGTDYQLTADQVDWTLGGAEPATGSSYDVTYRYRASIDPDSHDDTTVTISGGVTGEPADIAYTWKMCRVDLLCLDQAGGAVYVKGISSESTAVAPIVPSDLLPLAEITNTWTGKPAVENTTRFRAMHFDRIWTMYYRVLDALNLIGLERLRRDIDSREPVAKKGVFVDPFTDDRYRDQGEAQTAALFEGSMQLAIDPTFYLPALAGPVTLDYTEEVVASQTLVTGCMKVNPYQNFLPLPAEVKLTPSEDFWTEHDTQWTSPVTQVFGHGNRTRTTESESLVDERTELLEFLRQIDIDFTVTGFGNGETLDALTFDGIDVTPAGPLVADAGGQVTGTFTIPSNVTAGQKEVVATGGSGTEGSALFVGQGIVDIDVMQRVTTVHRTQPVRRRTNTGGGGGGGGGNWDRNGYHPDPLAQTFVVVESRHIAGIDLKWCAIGDPANPCVVEIHGVENGIPTGEILAQAYVDMSVAVQGAWTAVRFDLPYFIPAGRRFAIMIKTDDADHALAVATRGEFDAAAQQWVGAQPYAVGTLLSSADAATWTPHQDTDLAFRLVAATFDPTEKTVPLGNHDLSDASDLVARASVYLPTGDAQFYFEVERPNGGTYRLEPGQNLELTEYLTETVTLRGILKGSARVSPILYPGVMLIAGKLRTSGTYISRAFTMGTNIDLWAVLKTKLPAGSSVTVEVDAADDNWQALTAGVSSPLSDGWTEKEYEVNPFTAVEGRVRLTLTGTPAARPALADLRSYSM